MCLNERGAFVTRMLDDGRVLDVFPLITGTAQLCVSENIAALTYVDGW